jgi:alpha-aminoadipic semialdehyde synthase
MWLLPLQQIDDDRMDLIGPASQIPTPGSSIIPIENLATVLAAKLAYLPHERDSVLLHHTFALVRRSHPSSNVTSNPSVDQERGRGVILPRRDVVTASLTCYGTPETSAMSTTVGTTLAFAALRVLDGGVAARGVRGPYEREVWEGVLGDLERVGVRVEEKWDVHNA